MTHNAVVDVLAYHFHCCAPGTRDTMARRLHSFASGRPSSCQYPVTWKETHLDPAHTDKGRINLWQGVRRFLGKSPVPLSSWPRWGCINLWQGVRRVFRQGSCPPCVWNIWSTYRCHWVLIDWLICAMLDSVDYLCVTGGTALVVLCVSARGDASMRLRWTTLALRVARPWWCFV